MSIPTNVLVTEAYPSWKPYVMEQRMYESPLADPPQSSPAYTSLFDDVANITKDLAEDVFRNFYAQIPGRLHAGQSPAGYLAGAGWGSALHVPEIERGSLVAVSL